MRASSDTKPQMNGGKRRFIVSGLYRRGAGSLPAGLRQWRRAKGRGWGMGRGGAIIYFGILLFRNEVYLQVA